jgi:hypothetical protein
MFSYLRNDAVNLCNLSWARYFGDLATFTADADAIIKYFMYRPSGLCDTSNELPLYTEDPTHAGYAPDFMSVFRAPLSLPNLSYRRESNLPYYILNVVKKIQLPPIIQGVFEVEVFLLTCDR